MQTIIQALCSPGESLREKIVKDARLEDYGLIVSRQRSAGRNPGWAKIKGDDMPGAMNVEWNKDSAMLIGRVITKGSNKPDQLIGNFVSYLLARHRKRIRTINILPK